MSGRQPRTLAKLALLALPLVVDCGVYRVALAAKARAAERAWQVPGDSLDDFERRFPPTPANASALTLEELASRFEVGLSPEGSKRAHQNVEAKGDLAALQAWVKQQLARPEPAEELPPEAAFRFLTRHESDIAAFEAAAEQAEPPRWEIETDSSSFYDSGNMVGQKKLHDVLLGHALVLAGKGSHEEAARVVAVSWRLNDNAYHRPDIFSALIGVAVTRMQLGVLRKLEIPPDWLDQRAPLPARDSLRQGLRHTCWMMRKAGRDGGRLRVARLFGLDGTRAYRLQIDRVMGPLLRYTALDVVERAPPLLARLDALDPCDTDFEQLDREIKDMLPEYDTLPATLLPASTMVRAALLEVDVDFTRKVLEVKQHRRETGVWPEHLASTDVAGCPRRHWRLDAAGRHLELDGGPGAWQSAHGGKLPALEYRE